VTYTEKLEWILAAVWANYRPDEEPGGFFALEGEMQSLVVAAYEAHLQIDGVIAQEQSDEMRRARTGAK